ncbi:MAG: hypothetical protein ACYCYB_11870 [Candidatus Dormibacteria bacterium]
MIITIDAGSNASIGALASIIGDMSQVMDFGLTVDRAVAESSAVQEVDRLWRDEPSAILERFQATDEGEYAEVRSMVNERQLLNEFLDQQGPLPPDLWLEHWYQFRRRVGNESSRRYLTSSPFFLPFDRSASLQEVSPDSFARLVAIESADRLPGVPVVESLTYQNPIIIVFGIEAAIAAGFKYGTFVEFAKLIRDWSGIRHQRNAQIEKTQAETREINARASRIEFGTEWRRKMASLAIHVPAVGEVEPTSDQLDAIGRLANSDFKVEEHDDE